MQAGYVYDDSGNRVIKRGPDGETAYVNQYFTVRDGLIATKQVIVGGTLIASKLVAHAEDVYEDDQLFFHSDQVGSANYVTGTHGEVLEHLEYFPSGETWVQEAFGDAAGNTYQFAGKQFDTESGFYYFGARYYDPRTGIFETPDPALPQALANLPASPASVDVFAPSFLNPYNYADDRPLTVTDPTGGGPQQQDLDTKLLRQIAVAQGVSTGSGSIRDNYATGRLFQNTVLAIIGYATVGAPLPENTSMLISPARSMARGLFIFPSGPPVGGGVVPDALQPLPVKQVTIRVTPEGTEVSGPSIKNYPASVMYEAKAVNGQLTLEDNNSQLTGLLEVTQDSAAGRAGAVPYVIFATTTDTQIKGVQGNKLLKQATSQGVAVWQATAYAIQDPGGWLIGLNNPVILNPEVFGPRAAQGPSSAGADYSNIVVTPKMPYFISSPSNPDAGSAYQP